MPSYEIVSKVFRNAIPPDIFQTYPKLAAIAEVLAKDEIVRQYWECANMIAIKRLKINDHGRGHIRVVLGHAIKAFLLLRMAGIKPNLVTDYGLSDEDALIVILMAICFHDIGHIIARKDHGKFSIALAEPVIRRVLGAFYTSAQTTLMTAESLHAMYCHMVDSEVTTLEGGIVRFADALDIQEGRSTQAMLYGKMDIHGISAAAIKSVVLQKGKRHPIHVDIHMSNSSGIFQIDSLLRRKLMGSGIEKYVSVYAKIDGETEKKLIKEYKINL